MARGSRTGLGGTEWRAWVIVLVAAGAVYLPGLDRPLRDAEAKYAQIPAEMVQAGDWITPHLNHVPYYVKPPLSYWVTAAVYSVFGVSEATARLPNVLFAFLTAFLLGRLGRRLFDAPTGLLAGILLLLTTEVFVYCLDAGIEFGLIAMVLLAFVFFWRWRETGRLTELCLFHGALGLAFLVKGMPGWIVGLGSASLTLAFADRRALVRLYHPAGLASFAAIAGPWLVWMSAIHPDFVLVFFVNEHFHRFTGSMSSNDALFPTGLWLLLVAAELFPWILHVPGATLQLRRMVLGGAVAREKALFLGIWAALPLLVYSLSRSKVDFYGLEAYPPLLLGVAIALMDFVRGGPFASPRAWAAPWWIAAGAAAASFAALHTYAESAWVADLGIPSIPVALAFLLAAALAGGAAALLFTRRRPLAGVAAVGVLSLVLFQVQRITFAASHPHYSMKFAADLYNQHAVEGDLLVTDERPEFEHSASLVFYTGRQVLILRDREHSIMHFIERGRDALCIDEPELRALAADQRVFLVGESAALRARLTDLGLRFEVLGSQEERALFLVPGGDSSGRPAEAALHRERVESGP